MCYGAKRRSPIKRRNMSQMHVYMSFYTCQADGLRPLRSLDVFHVACFWGLCEAATSESTTSASFNKQSLPISSPLSQTNRMIKRHTWGEPRGNLPFSLPLCATLCLFLPVLCVLLAYIFSWFWMEPSPQQYHVMRWSNTLMCQGFPFPTQDLVTLVHFIYCQPCTLSHIFFFVCLPQSPSQSPTSQLSHCREEKYPFARVSLHIFLPYGANSPVPRKMNDSSNLTGKWLYLNNTVPPPVLPAAEWTSWETCE